MEARNSCAMHVLFRGLPCLHPRWKLLWASACSVVEAWLLAKWRTRWLCCQRTYWCWQYS
eukprot:6205965-Pleurochrysis_carterae.AAC.1